jgi:hypothetical protein
MQRRVVRWHNTPPAAATQLQLLGATLGERARCLPVDERLRQRGRSPTAAWPSCTCGSHADITVIKLSPGEERTGGCVPCNDIPTT